MKILATILKEKQIKVTPQRLAIYDVLYNTTKHPSAEKIYSSLQQSYPTMSLATIYKTLDAFKKAGIIQELSIGSDCLIYDANTSPHPHGICLNCGNVYDIKTNALDNITNLVQNDTDFEIKKYQMYFYGYCPNCK